MCGQHKLMNTFQEIKVVYYPESIEIFTVHMPFGFNG